MIDKPRRRFFTHTDATSRLQIGAESSAELGPHRERSEAGLPAATARQSTIHIFDKHSHYHYYPSHEPLPHHEP